MGTPAPLIHDEVLRDVVDNERDVVCHRLGVSIADLASALLAARETMRAAALHFDHAETLVGRLDQDDNDFIDDRDHARNLLATWAGEARALLPEST